MTDTCTHCTVRGDINECHATPCSTHISWYAQQQQAEIRQLKELIGAIRDDMDDFVHHVDATLAGKEDV